MAALTQLNDTASAVLFEEAVCENGMKIGFATLNAPKSLNALNLEMIELLAPQLKAWDQDEDIALVVLKGSGEKAFCAGGDVVSLYNAMKTGAPQNYICDFFSKEYQLDYAIHCYRKPILLWGHGIIMGGGLGLMAGASHRVVTETARIAMPEITIGLYPDVGGSYFLHKMPEQVGLFLGLTGASINCDDARFVSLADHFVQSSKYDEMVSRLLTIKWGKTVSLNHEKLTELLKALDNESDKMPKGEVRAHLGVIQKMGEFETLADKVEYILSLPDDNKWLARAKSSLAHGSPLSAALVERQLVQSKGKTLAECFKMELGMSVTAGETGEFQEGVRALLIDKDGQPDWRFKAVSDVDPKVVDTFFSARWDDKTHPLTELK